MVKKQTKLLAVGHDGIYAQDMRLFVRDVGIVRLVAYGLEERGMYLDSTPNSIDEANNMCSMAKMTRGYSAMEMTQLEYKTLKDLIPKEDNGRNIQLSSRAEKIIQNVTRRNNNPSSLY